MNRIKPTSRQLEFQSWEMGLFIHFGIRTFYEGHKDWDGKAMSPAKFNPSQLDCGQWARTIKEAGGNYMVMTAKHHDGFANWPSAYTDYSVASSPWKNGRGDVVSEFTDACREYGLKIGLYYSPADINNPDFDNPVAYDDYFINQMSELFDGNYGNIDMVWFDGAHSEKHQYDWTRIIKEIRRQQPDILIFNMGDPDYRWCGNEDGFAEYPNWNATETVNFSIFTEEKQKSPGGKAWLPQECDFRIRDPNWFFSENDANTVKSAEELLGNYYYSVGRGANMLLNIAPDRRGMLPEPDCDSLISMGKKIKRRFKEPVFSIDAFTRKGNKWEHCLQNPVSHANSYLIDHVIIRENLSGGESVKKFRISALMHHYGGLGKTVKVFEGYNIGNKAICSFPPVRCRGIIIEILKHDGPIKIESIDAFSNTGK